MGYVILPLLVLASACVAFLVVQVVKDAPENPYDEDGRRG